MSRGVLPRFAIVAGSIVCVVSVASTTALAVKPDWAAKLHGALVGYSGSLGSWLESNWVVSIVGSLIAGVIIFVVGGLWKRYATKGADDDQ